MAQINTRITFVDNKGEPVKLQSYDVYVWLPRGTIVKQGETEYVVDSYRINISKNILDVIVIKK